MNGYRVFLLGFAEVACTAGWTLASSEAVDVGPGPLKPNCAIKLNERALKLRRLSMGTSEAEKEVISYPEVSES